MNQSSRAACVFVFISVFTLGLTGCAAAPTPTPVPPTFTAVPTAVPSATRAPSATATTAPSTTATPVPPSPTATRVPATATTLPSATSAAKPTAAAATATSGTASTSGSTTAASKDVCLTCHGPFDKLISATASYVAPSAEKGSPHRYVPHDSKAAIAVPECTNCHAPHPVPPPASMKAAPANVDWCYGACHHQADFTPCANCHKN